MQIPDKLYNNIGFMIADVARLYRVLFDREMQPLGLTKSQWWALVHVYYYDGISQKELSEILEIDKSATGKLLKRLEDKGWLHRRADKSDGRAQTIHLAEKIQPVMEKITSLSDQLIARSIEDVSATRLKALHSGIKQLDERLTDLIDNTPDEIAKLRNKIREDLEAIS